MPPQSYYKICPQCKTAATTDAKLCVSCGHKFRTTFPRSASEHVSGNITKQVAKPRNGQTLATIGFRVACAGIVWALYSTLFFDISVPLSNDAASPTGIDRIHNIGLMKQQTLWVVIGVIGAVVGAILMAAGHSKGEEIDWKYVLFGSLAKKDK